MRTVRTIKAILKDHGIAPAPERGTHTSWKTFLAAHWDGLAAADSFTVEVLTLGGLVRYVTSDCRRTTERRDSSDGHFIYTQSSGADAS